MRNFFLQLLLISAVSFSFHYTWENIHLLLYANYEGLTDMPIVLYATFGDVMYVIGAVLFVSLLKWRLDWLNDVTTSDVIGLAVVGFAIAFFVEYKALVFERWTYTDAMPIIPLLGIGFSPVLQMTILLPLSVWIAARFFMVHCVDTMKKIFSTLILAVLVVVGMYVYNSMGGGFLFEGINAEIDTALLNAPIDVRQFGGSVMTLQNGEAVFDVGDEKGFVKLGKPHSLVVKGDDADVFALLHINGGGTGMFQYLVQYEYTGSSKSLIEKNKILLGDRITVLDITTEIVAPTEYVVTVALKDRKPSESMTTEPTEARLAHFKKGDDGLKISAITFGTAEKHDVVMVSPLPHEEIDGPTFVILGAARGSWYFEAGFPISLQTTDGEVLTTTVAQAQGDWMTSELVPFQTTMVVPNTAKGYYVLVLKKNNPSGLPEQDKSIEIPVILK